MNLVKFAAIALVIFASSIACAKDGKLTFNRDRMIEVAFLKVKPGQEARLSKEYFPKVIPIAKEYGIRPLMTFRVSKVDHGPRDKVGLWGFFEWPSVARKAEFEKDPRFAKLRAFRDSLLVEPPKQIYTRVQKTITAEVDKAAAYEAAVVWTNPHREARLKDYFAAAGPFIQKKGVKFIGQFEVIGQPEDPKYRFDSLPNRFLFIQWPNWEVKNEWFSSEEFAQAGHHRALALDRLFIVESAANLP